MLFNLLTILAIILAAIASVVPSPIWTWLTLVLLVAMFMIVLLSKNKA